MGSPLAGNIQETKEEDNVDSEIEDYMLLVPVAKQLQEAVEVGSNVVWLIDMNGVTQGQALEVDEVAIVSMSSSSRWARYIFFTKIFFLM